MSLSRAHFWLYGKRYACQRVDNEDRTKAVARSLARRWAAKSVQLSFTGQRDDKAEVYEATYFDEESECYTNALVRIEGPRA